MKQIYFTICILLLAYMLPAQSSIPTIPGWKMQERNGSYSFIPAAVEGNKSFIYEVKPLQKGSGDAGSSWFKGIANSDAQQAGYIMPANDNVSVNVQNGLYNYTIQVSDKNGKNWLLSYVGYQLNNGEYRLARMISSSDITYFKSNIQPVVTHFGKLAKQDGFDIKSTGSGTAGRSAERTTTTSTTSGKVKSEELITANGLKPAEIKGIAINLEYIAGVGGGIYPSYEPYLLLTDGSIYDGPSVSPYNFDVAKSKQLEPRKWGTWKAVGKTMVINWPNKEKDKTDTWEKNWFWAKPATNGEKIQGGYKTISGGGNTALGGNVMIVSSTNITFNKNGQFTMVGVSGGSNNGDFGVSSSSYAHKDGAGTYVLNGYSLELRYNNGQVQQKSFYFYPDSKEAFGIGTSAYVPAGKK